MPPDEMGFQIFFVAKIKDRGLSLKKLSEATGIAQAHLENMVHGNFDDLPSAPYVHGYIVRLGKALDFDGDAWWSKIKEEGFTKNSGEEDILPKNRFIKQSQTKFIWAGIIAAIIIIYAAFQIPIIFGRPTITITSPTQNPFTTASDTLTIEGTVQNANSLSLNGDPVAIAPDGSWQKTVLLQSQGGLNNFQIVAKKLLGREADVTEQIFYDGEPAASASSTNSSSTASTTPGAAASTSATAKFPSNTSGTH